MGSQGHLAFLSLQTLGGGGVFSGAQAGGPARALLLLVTRWGRKRRGHNANFHSEQILEAGGGWGPQERRPSLAEELQARLGNQLRGPGQASPLRQALALC